MPNIKQEDRPQFRDVLEQMPPFLDKGELEYCVTWLQNHFISTQRWCYHNLHDAVYAVQHCADEFRRKHLDPYEDEAEVRNGPVE